MSTTHSSKPWLFDFISLGALWGSSFMAQRLGAGEFGALPTAGVRVAVASLFLLPLLLWRDMGAQLVQHWRHIAVVGLINSAIPFVCFAFAVLSITSGLASIMNATAPMFGAVIAWLWLKDKPNGSRILGLIVGFFGVALLAWDKASFKPGASATGWAVLACLLACLCYGIAASYTKRYLSGVPSLVTACGSQLSATVALALPTLWFWPSHNPSAQAWWSLLWVGVACTGLAYVLFFRIIGNIGTRTLSVTFMIPMFGVLFGAVFLAEEVTAWMLLCGVVIVCGTALSTGLVKLGRQRALQTHRSHT